MRKESVLETGVYTLGELQELEEASISIHTLSTLFYRLEAANLGDLMRL